MKEVSGDIWRSGADVVCVTTNGVVKSDGTLVMGAGLAKQAAFRLPELPEIFGAHVLKNGNTPCAYYFVAGKRTIVSLPTKHDWRDDSDIDLIVRSLVQISNMFPDKSIALTRPGCGLGGLDWNLVRKRVEPLLDDRFTIYS